MRIMSNIGIEKDAQKDACLSCRAFDLQKWSQNEETER
jgi:hypothetical protein